MTSGSTAYTSRLPRQLSSTDTAAVCTGTATPHTPVQDGLHLLAGLNINNITSNLAARSDRTIPAATATPQGPVQPETELNADGRDSERQRVLPAGSTSLASSVVFSRPRCQARNPQQPSDHRCIYFPHAVLQHWVSRGVLCPRKACSDTEADTDTPANSRTLLAGSPETLGVSTTASTAPSPTLLLPAAVTDTTVVP